MKQWTVREPFFTSTHSPWRGDFSSLALAQSWAETDRPAHIMTVIRNNFIFMATGLPERDEGQS
jgi:hypothetical protein